MNTPPMLKEDRQEQNSVFVLPVLDQYLVYAPLCDFAALIDRVATRQIQEKIHSQKNNGTGPLAEILHILRSNKQPLPEPKTGPLSPAFLGLIPTRGCNLACKYCGFLAAQEPEKVMDLQLARDVLDWHFELASQRGMTDTEVHFFGGEPFCAEKVVDFAVHYAKRKAAETGIAVRFEIATNGIFDENRCRWAANSFDTIILSLDGPADIQDHHRHRKDGRGSFETVAQSARLLSEGSAELSFRSCVTADTVDRMPAIAAWLCQEFRPVSIGFEPLQPSPASKAAALLPPDPWPFVQGFTLAAEILRAHGVKPVYGAADIHTRRVSFCPVGQDVAIVSPDGAVNACYLLSEEWQAKGFDLRMGQVEDGSVRLDGDAVSALRELNVWTKPLCAGCFCKWHCAGGCHVNHAISATTSHYDRLCIQTRLITLRNLLEALGRETLMRDLLGDASALDRMVWQASDALEAVELRA